MYTLRDLLVSPCQSVKPLSTLTKHCLLKDAQLSEIKNLEALPHTMGNATFSMTISQDPLESLWTFVKIEEVL